MPGKRGPWLRIRMPLLEDGPMRAAICRELGAPDVLELAELDDPTPGPRQVVVAVRAAGVNYVDALFVSGEYQIKPALPFVPGSEISGEVIAVGSDVDTAAPGDRVLVSCGLGGYAEQVCVDASQVVAIPDDLDHERAATFTQSYCTALFALRTRARVAADETLLVLGAGGGVGLATIDVATALGLDVIAAASTSAKREAALAMGARAAIDTVDEDLKTRARELTDGRGVDVVIDPVGGDLAEPALRTLAYLGRYLVIGFAGGAIPRLPLNQVLLRNRSILGVDWGAWGMAHPDENQGLLHELLQRVAAGTLHPAAPTTFGLDQAPDALHALLSRQVTGKVALVI
jgi:NADPH:quinone reductase